MSRAKELAYKAFYIIDGSNPIPEKDVSDRQKKMISERGAEKVGRVLSDYFTAHPDEFTDFFEEENPDYKYKEKGL